MGTFDKMLNNLKDEEFMKEACKQLYVDNSNELPDDFYKVLDEEMKAQHGVLEGLGDD